MSSSSSVTVLCLASYEKGADFIRECRRQGCRVLLITTDKLKDIAWPRDAIDGFYHMPELTNREQLVNAVSWLARQERIDRIVPLDEFDLELAAALREHMRVPGMGETTVRHFRDKLAMRQRAAEAGILVPEFTPVLNHDVLRDYMGRVPGPWVLKPRTEAAAIGIRKLATADEVWHVIEELGDRQSHHLMERYVPGDVFHVDSIVDRQNILFAEVHRYAVPPFDVAHSGGLFSTRTVARGSAEEAELESTTQALASALGMRHGVMHTEFIRAAADGRFYFLETAARVGGAHIVELVEAATGINLWREWARIEVADVRQETYSVPEHRQDYAGLLLSLARQEWPDTSAFDDPEIVWRVSKRHHAGLIVRSAAAERVAELLDGYVPRFYEDFHASLPAPDRPTA